MWNCRFARSAAVACSITLGALTGVAQSPKPAPPRADTGFSFAVYGDSRSMMYLPAGQEQQAAASELLTNMISLLMPAPVAVEVIQKATKFTYDPTTKQLVQIVMPFESSDQIMTMRVDQGWVTQALVENVKFQPGVQSTMFRLEGGDWVAREVARTVKTGRASFIVNTGDMVWWGKQGVTPLVNPYWSLVNENVMKDLPPADAEMKAAGVPGRVFPAVGNHDVWNDSDVQGLLSVFPYLKQLGVSDKQLIYKFDYQGARFIFLWTGFYDYTKPSGWQGTNPAYDAQMTQLTQWLEEAKAAGTKHVFVSFHSPVFVQGEGGLPENQSPRKILAKYAKDLDIVVFTGHVHTTYLYEADGVKYLMLGGGGGEQNPSLPGQAPPVVPAGYPAELYWQGALPKEEYNYLLVDVRPGSKTKFTMVRFRPGTAEPFSSAEIYRGR